MSQTCKACGHPEREAIDQALIKNEPFRHIAARHGVSTGTLQRHRPHLTKDLVRVREAVEVARSERLLDCVRDGEGRAERMYAAAEAIMVRALESEDLRTALNAIRTAVDVMGEARQYMELRGELSGEFEKEKAPAWPEARIVITRDEDPVPELPTSSPLLLPEPGSERR